MHGNLENRCREGGGGGLQRARLANLGLSTREYKKQRHHCFAVETVTNSGNGSRGGRVLLLALNFHLNVLTCVLSTPKRAMHPISWVPAL